MAIFRYRHKVSSAVINLSARDAGLDADSAWLLTILSSPHIGGLPVETSDPYGALAYIDAQLSVHTTDTTSVHGIVEALALETQAGAAARVAEHADDPDAHSGAVATPHSADTTNVHGIADTTALETVAGAAAKVANHDADDDAHGTLYEKKTSIVVNDEVPNDYTTLASALTAIGSNEGHLSINRVVTLTGNTTIPANITLRFTRRGRIALNGYTLTIGGGFEVGRQAVFTGTGTVTWAGGARITVFPEWWGAKGDDATDDSAALQATVDSCPTGGEISLAPRTYRVLGSGTEALLIGATNKTLRLEGAGFASWIRADPSMPNTRDIIRIAPTAGTAGWSIKRMRIGGATPVGRHAIHIDTTAGSSSVYDCSIEELLVNPMANGYSIYHESAPTNPTGGFFYSNISKNNLNQIRLEYSGDTLTIDNNVITGAGTSIYVSQFTGVGGLAIQNNTLANSGGIITIDSGIAPKIVCNTIAAEGFSSFTQPNGALIDLNGAVASIFRPLVFGNQIQAVSGITGVVTAIRVAGATFAVIDDNWVSVFGSTKHIITTSSSADCLAGPANNWQLGAVSGPLVMTSGGTRDVTTPRDGSPNVQFFTASGTWTKPANAKAVRVTLIGGGGGGGSGRRGAAGTVRCGGGGGGGGGITDVTVAASDLSLTVAVTVGAGGTGGAAVTADDTNGSPGTGSASTTFGSYCSAIRGGNGSGGTATTGLGGAGGSGTSIGAAGGSASGSGGTGLSGGQPAGAPGGQSGGGITAADSASAGAASGYTGYTAANGTAGAVDGAAPTAGADVTLSAALAGGASGSGAASITGAAQAGAAGGKYGAGGSGGGASLNGNNSGAGGNGGQGCAHVVTYF